MSENTEKDILNYYYSYCELTIWFKKIVLSGDLKQPITIEDITNEFTTERDRILLFIPAERRRSLKTRLNKIAKDYYIKVTNWSIKQKITVDMV